MPSANASWRQMLEADLEAVNAIADRVHVDYPEDAAVFRERLSLYPAGAFVLDSADGVALGYALTHPWHFMKPPELDVLLGALPDLPSTYYIHDIAIVPEGRGAGAATEIVRQILAHARESGAPNVSLVAVNKSGAFWARHGFLVVSDPSLDEKLKSYDEDARFMVLGF